MAASPSVLRLTERAVLCVLHGAQPLLDTARDGAVSRLRRAYDCVPDIDLTWFSRKLDQHSILILGTESAVVAEPDAIVVGLPIGASGPATDAEVLEVLTRPDRGRHLLGAWIAVGLDDPSIRVVSSPDLRHTLKTATRQDQQCWSNRSLASLLALGARPQVNRDVVPEFVLLDYVLGDLELLEGVRVLPEASVVGLDAEKRTESSYWPVEDRMRPGAPTSAADLTTLLTEELQRVATIPELWIALTAGRDSRLAAACLHSSGGSAATFTMGAGTPDAHGAADLAERYGWPHQVLTGEAWSPAWTRAVHASTWTDGSQISRDILGKPLNWPFGAASCAIWGSGGEIGRAFYWAGAGADRAQRQFQQRPAAMTMATPARRAWHERSGTELAAATAAAGGDPLRGLDVVYARGRMRKWLARGMLAPNLLGTVTAFTSPAVTRALMDLPIDQRTNSSAFDEALANCRLPTAGKPKAAPAGRTPSRLRQKLGTRHGDLEAALRSRGSAPEFVTEILGRSWWAGIRRHAGDNPSVVLKAWNALSVQALVELLEQLA